ncbi:MAG: hypothetical protein EOO07_19115 [Chitinophagaceae bacterium]|nr:MAG: hypothetical protein EOO07_19115 [Chitinophagaceae bacterium]
MKKTYLILKFIACISCASISQLTFSSTPVELKNEFSVDEIKWVTKKGNSSVYGEAFLKLNDGTLKDCSGFNIELLPAAKYSNERIFKTYGNNNSGQILLEDNPPKFTPDVKEYHEMLIKSTCDNDGKFIFNNVPSGNYYLIAFIIWDANESNKPTKTGGAVMKRVEIRENSKHRIELKP